MFINFDCTVKIPAGIVHIAKPKPCLPDIVEYCTVVGISSVQVPENRNVVLIPPKISIIVRSGVNNIAPLSEKDFYAFVDYKWILLDTSGTVQPNITGPENVVIVQQNPVRIQYVVRK